MNPQKNWSGRCNAHSNEHAPMNEGCACSFYPRFQALNDAVAMGFKPYGIEPIAADARRQRAAAPDYKSQQERVNAELLALDSVKNLGPLTPCEQEMVCRLGWHAAARWQSHSEKPSDEGGLA